MRKLLSAIGLTVAGLGLLNASANADHERGFFLGGAGSYTATDVASPPANEDEINHTGFELVGGYKFNGWLGVDARYGAALSDRSLATVRADSSAPRGRLEYDIDGYQSVYYRPEITNKEAKLYFLLGYTQLDTSIQAVTLADDGTETAGEALKRSDSGTSYGIGAGWFVDEHVNINVEYRRLLDENEDELDIITIGADYRF